MMWDFILRLFVAGILGAVVGLDREYRAKEAGYRTHFLVSLGSALIMVVSQYGFQDVILENSVSLDPSRVGRPSGEWHRFHRGGYDHHPETIRAGIDYRRRYLATAGIGLAVGSGMYGLGIAATLLTLAGLELLSVIFKSIGMRSSLVVFSTSDKEAINRIARVIYEKGFLLVSYDMKRLGHQEKDEYVVSIVLKARKNTEESPLLLLMEQFPEVTVERIE